MTPAVRLLNACRLGSLGPLSWCPLILYEQLCGEAITIADQIRDNRSRSRQSEVTMETENLPERPKAAKPKKEKPPKQPKGPAPPKPKRAAATKPAPEDPESMFKVGFLSDVYQERPIGNEGITKIITRVR